MNVNEIILILDHPSIKGLLSSISMALILWGVGKAFGWLGGPKILRIFQSKDQDSEVSET